MKSSPADIGGALIALCILAGIVYAVYHAGYASGKSACEAAHSKADVTVLQAEKADTQKAVNRGAKTGAVQVRQRAVIDTAFDQIALEQNHAPADPVDSCVLPADRLRLWAAANAGATGQGAAAGNGNGTAQAPAATGLRPDARLGIQPHGGDQGLSPARAADVHAAGLPGDQP